MSDRKDHEPMDISDDPLADAQFWNSFRSFGTTDHDDLISQFRHLTMTTLTDKGITFFLELASWNLQSAICAYYDSETPEHADQVPSVVLMRDNTFADGESVSPSTRFSKSWRFKNIGDDSWPSGTEFHFISGDLKPTKYCKVLHDGVAPQKEFDITVQLTSPSEPGTYKSQFGFRTPQGVPFGEMVWAIVPVEAGGVLGITQQLNSLNNFGSPSQNDREPASPQEFRNPFMGHSTRPVQDEVAQVTEGFEDIRIDDEEESN